jgi:aspartate/methionine/tyrosine aminotransferase
MLNSSSDTPLSPANLRALLAAPEQFDPCPDNGMLRAYIDSGCPAGPPLPLALGEAWRGAPSALIDLLAAAPGYCDGYMLAPAGLPDLHDALVGWLSAEYATPLDSGAIQVGSSPTGTRSLMHAFGAWLILDHWRARPCYFTSFTPSWDYAGVFRSLGFIDNMITLCPENGFQPNLDHVEAAINSVPKSARQLLVLNPQHNPTAINWSAATLSSIVAMARDAGAAILLDDAYHGMTDADERPSAALPMMIDAADTSGAPFVMVRSLGKQFACNGWSIGAYVGSAASILGMQGQLAARALNVGGRAQWALSRWIGSAAAQADVEARRTLQRAARQTATATLPHLGVTSDDIITGTAAPYIIFRTPPSFRKQSHATARFLAVAARHGVSLSPLLPSAQGLGTGHDDSWVRMYLGLGSGPITEAIERLGPAMIGSTHHAG